VQINKFMELNFKSNYDHFSNQTLNWLPMDTEELYKNNLKNNYDMLKNNGWITNSVHYKFNSCGFRCEQFDNYPNILFIGCSLTLGIGINSQDRWTDLVSKELELKCYNLGIGGGSSDTAYRLLLGWIFKLNPTMVIFRVPPGIRLELVNQKEILNLQNVKKSLIRNFFLDNYIRYYSVDDMNNQLNYLKNLMAMKYLCIQQKVKFIETKTALEDFYDYARDLAHPGIISNQKYAENVLSLI